MDRFKAAQAAIDEMFANPSPAEEKTTDRILRFAKRGLETPEGLSGNEIRQVCYALVVHYAQMGIG